MRGRIWVGVFAACWIACWASGATAAPGAAVGDRSDKATLLVALLRQAGVRADVALVAAGWDQVLDPELPGLGAFDRALVRARVGARELWIDPGEPMARPGQLPEQAQGRRALVIADDVKALVLTPTAAPTDNTVRDVRTFTAPEQGLSRLTQVVQYTGALEIEQRRWARSARGDALKKQHSHQTNRCSVERWSRSPPRTPTI